MALRLPDPMLARPGSLPTGAGWSFEPKWDGFRAVVRCGDEYAVRSRRGWLMTELLPEFAALPVRASSTASSSRSATTVSRLSTGCVPDAQPGLVCAGRACALRRAQTRRRADAATPYRERRELLESLSFGLGCHVSPRFDDNEALWASVVAHRLEGVVAKRLRERYQPGERLWVKKKNPAWPRYAAEREAAIRQRRRRI